MSDQVYSQPSHTCSQCGEKYAPDEMIQIQSLFVCANCKPAVVQKIKEGVALAPKKKRQVGWKIFFFFILGMDLLGAYFIILDLAAREKIIQGLLELATYPLFLTGIYGYAFRKRFFHRKLWQILFPVVLIFDIIVILMTIYRFAAEGAGLLVIAAIHAIVIPLFIFQYIVLYRYSYSKTEPWL